MKKYLSMTCVAAISVASQSAAATYTLNNLVFETTAPQSSWGSGAAAELSATKSFTQSWDAEATVGHIQDLGTAPHPSWAAENLVYQGAVTAYNTANTAYTPLNNAYNDVLDDYNECLDSFGGTEVGCGIAHGTQLGATFAARETALGTLNTAAGVRDRALIERDRYPQTIDLGELGAAATIETSGTVGVEFAYKLSAGSVDPILNFSLGADVPDEVAAGEAFQISSSSNLNSGSVNSQSPTFEASISQVLDVELSASATTCGPAGCDTGGATLIDVDEKLEIVSIDPNEVKFLDGYIDLFDPTDTVKLALPIGNVTAQVWQGFQGTPPAPSVGLTVNSVPVRPGFAPAIELARATITVPNIQTVGAKSGEVIQSEGSANVINLQADIDGLAPQIPAGGFTAGFGPAALNAGVTVDAFDIKAGPTLDMFQEFEISSTLMVDLMFDRAIQTKTLTGYGTKIVQTCSGSGIFRICLPEQVTDLTKPIYTFAASNRWIGAWDDLPDFTLLESTWFTPTFFTAATLHSTTGVQLGIGLDLSIGSGSVTLGPGAGLSFGPLYHLGLDYNPDFGKFSVFDESFALNGWNHIQGDSFLVKVAGSQTPPPPVTTPPLSAVPLSPSSSLLATGLAALFMMRRRRKTAA